MQNRVGLTNPETVKSKNVSSSEVSDFTPLLLKNVYQLEEELGLWFENPEIEESNDDKSTAAIVATNVITERRVIIENRLKDSDDKLLGQTITKAANKDAGNVIWLVEKALYPLVRTVNWLNKIAEQDDPELKIQKNSFFLVEVKLTKTPNSSVVPEFKVKVKPEKWDQQKARRKTLLYKTFFKDFKEKAFSEYPELKKDFKSVSSQNENWAVLYSSKDNDKDKEIGLRLNEKGGKTLQIQAGKSGDLEWFSAIKQNIAKIERLLGFKVTLFGGENEDPALNRGFRISTGETSFDDTANWDGYIKWFAEQAPKMFSILNASPEEINKMSELKNLS